MPRKIPFHQAVPSVRSERRQYESTPIRLLDKRFYASAPWRKLRAAYLAQHPLCEDCTKAGRTVLAEHVHHVVERKADHSRALDWDNLEAACQACHNAKRGRS